MVGYVRRHWRGEHPLAQSYWINVFGLSVVIFLILEIVGSVVDWSGSSPYQILFSLVTISLITIIVWVWQIAGCWRSANNHVMRTRRRWWARLVQVLIVIGAIGAFGQLFALTMMITEVTRIALRQDSFQDVTITLINHEELQIQGYITFDVPEEIENYLKYNPNITYIHLNSPGGRIGPARRLRDLIGTYQLITYTSEGCFSACTLPFMAGRQRVLHTKANLGFHQMEMPGLSRAEIASEETVDKRYFLSKGIPDRFLRRAYSTPHSDMWYPTLDELVEANVVTHFFDGEKIIAVR